MRLFHQNVAFDAQFLSLGKERIKLDTLAFKLASVAERVLRIKSVNRLQLILESVIGLFLFLPIPLFSGLIWRFIYSDTGLMGYYLRSLLFRQNCAFVGVNVLIGANVTVKHLSELKINSFAYLDQGVTIMCPTTIGRHCHIAVKVFVSGGGCLKVEDYASMGMKSIVLTATETAGKGFRVTGPMARAEERNVIRRKTLLRKDAFTGPFVLIFPGITMVEGSVVTRGSVLRRNTRDWTVYHGNPASAISSRQKVV